MSIQTYLAKLRATPSSPISCYKHTSSLVLIGRYTVIRFVWVSAKFGTCTVVRVNGALVEDIIGRFKGECAHLASTSVPFILTTVQVPNLALSHTKQITVYLSVSEVYNTPPPLFLRTIQIIQISNFFYFFLWTCAYTFSNIKTSFENSVTKNVQICEKNFLRQIPRSMFHVSIMICSTILYTTLWICLELNNYNNFINECFKSQAFFFTCRFPKEKKDVLLLAKSQIADGITVQGVWKSVFPVHKIQSIRDHSTGARSNQNRNFLLH